MNNKSPSVPGRSILIFTACPEPASKIWDCPSQTETYGHPKYKASNPKYKAREILPCIINHSDFAFDS